MDRRCNHVAANAAPSVAVVAGSSSPAARCIGGQQQQHANAIPLSNLLSRRSSFTVTEGDFATAATDGDHSDCNWNGSNGTGNGSGSHRKVDTAVLATSSMVSTPRYRGGGGRREGSSRGGSQSDHRAGILPGQMGQSSQHRIFGSQEEYGAIHLGRLQASAIR